MKKRRVLALLLALSLAVGMNGMTVLATAPDAAAVSSAAGEDSAAAEEGEQPEHMQQPETSGEGEQSAGQDSEGTAGDEEVPGPPDGVEGDTSVGDGSEDQRNPDGQIQDGGPEEGDQTDQPSEEDKTGSEGENSGREENPGDDASEDTGNPEEGEPKEDGTEESVSDNTLEEEELPETAKPEVRMMTFTDDTGMKVTYDANTEYELTIMDGVLEGITNSNGSSVTGVVAVPEGKGITAIGSAFKGNESITYVKLPKGVVSIQDDAFNNCHRLQGIYLPKELQTIGNKAFYRCTGLLKIAVPKQVASIGNAAFYEDEKLFMVYMQDADYSNLVSIGDQAFFQCRALEHFCSDRGFIIPGKLESIGDFAFYGCRAVKGVDFNESVQTIGESAFQECISLKEVVLSSKVSVISKNAFAGCNGLLRVQFKNGNNTIGESAFKGCVKLSSLQIPGTVRAIENYAFADCSRLVAVEVVNYDVAYGDSVFPNMDTLTLRGPKGSTTEEYTYGTKIKFVAYDEDVGNNFYKYAVTYSGTGSGELQIKDAGGNDPNLLNNKKGVTRGTKLYVYVKTGEGSRLVAGSIKCNGESLKEEKGAEGEPSKLYFEMPIGGAVFTAEFENIASSNRIDGLDADVKVEISNGEVVTAADGEVIRVNLKAGQYSRMFLTDVKADNKAIPSSKITFQSTKKTIATVSNDGTIHAIKKGQADITARVLGSDDKPITRTVRVNVESAGAAQINIKASGYDTRVIHFESSPTDAVQTAVIDKNRLPDEGVKFQLRATVYDSEEDSIAMTLKWSSSDSKVAKLSKSSSTVDDPSNTVTIPGGTNGEATIRVTATNADKKTVTQKFIIRVIEVTPRLVSANLTVNPNRTDGAVLQIVSAYGKAVDNNSVKLVKYDGEIQLNCRDFDFTYLKEESDSTVSSFRITAADPEMENSVHNVRVNINGGAYELPLKITVKRSKPNPKIAFEKKQPKINLFYADDETEVKVNVSNLGKDEVSDYELRPLSDKEDDKKFTENFGVEYVDKDTCIIRQQVDNLECANNGKGKPVLTGYLRLYYEGYSEDAFTDCKITIPAQRTAPSYKLNRTSDTFRNGCGSQEIELQIVDKKNKPVDLSDGGYVLSFVNDESGNNSIPVEGSGPIDLDDTGIFTLTLKERARAGKVKLRLTNPSSWAKNEKFDFTYSVKMTNATPKISLTDGPESTVALKSSTVNMTPNYPEQTVEFGLKSNQKGVLVAEDQTFTAKPTKSLAGYYQYLEVEYANGVGSVTVNDPEMIKDGTYTYVCEKARYILQDEEYPANKVTLKVKVKKGYPTVSVKGSLTFNNQALTDDGSFAERSELTLVSKNLPEDYEFDIGETEIKCKTKNKGGYESRFDWELIDRQVDEDGKITEGRLAASLNEYCANGTYKFSILPAYSGPGGTLKAKKAVNFNVKVHSGTISVSLSAKGKINLLDRFGEHTSSNSIVYTPSIKNVKDKVAEVRVFDYDENSFADYDGPESELFEAWVAEKDGKIYVRPREGASLESNKAYKVWIWAELENYKFPGSEGGGTFCNLQTIKTAQTLPKVTTDRSAVNLYLSNKNYVATFVVNKSDAKAIGNVESITFGEKDTKAQESFVTTEDEKGKPTVIESEQLDDGSLLVKLKLRDTVLYGCDTTNKLTMYVRFEGQGTNTPGTAITMNVKINK